MAVNLTRIYTKTGDEGQTHLGDMSRVSKTHPRIEAYGDVDELNSHLGVVVATGGLDERIAAILQRVQNDLFDVGADLAVPADAGPTKAGERLRVAPEQITWLEAQCDELNEALEPLRSFLLPGGTVPAAQLHVARTICRRAERRVLLVEDHTPETRHYLNRLSDLLFILARTANVGHDEPLWQPGLGRES
ncbi:MAG: cob(I)yrinic acid a,c-diamide adenosyltransferase [Solirubrobacteraceae bacterium]|nr:cob(I)yrinic acid a,c-diamide adenosyltransferase [Solirubrobacteraceae bacterium]